MTVDYSCAEGIAQVHLNRPERLNAVVPALVEDLLAAFARAREDEARVIVLAGRGKAFCAGHDLKEPVPVETEEQTRARLERIQDVTRAIRDFPGVVIAAVHGYALGAGAEFALGCDLIVTGGLAKFGFPEVSVGLSVTGGISSLLPKMVGPHRAKQLLLLGEHITGGTLMELGVVYRDVIDHEKHAMKLAKRIAAQPPVAALLAKRALDQGLGSTLDQALATEVDHAVITSTSGEGDKPREEFGRG
ncbi:Enoyl-CoA hydratase/carnithine racemase [Lentzea waywayandensis]|uniref:Enoyl-CoA hydratase/carnithine racemase n=1 Tax=Lentzea waywayandensis TaxID=84724 RepID=A0A1I6FIM9_9PSEU|nr:enoyl-CoA hydratase/isomerase family protein [Lentzea waywayandensis]SFR29748.1 Enoyl-CoA hydratase/carnithine racemase [Lentzea waywayandensis]